MREEELWDAPKSGHFTLWWTNSLLLKMAIEIVDYPINSMVIFHCKMLVHQRVKIFKRGTMLMKYKKMGVAVASFQRSPNFIGRSCLTMSFVLSFCTWDGNAHHVYRGGFSFWKAMPTLQVAWVLLGTLHHWKLHQWTSSSTWPNGTFKALIIRCGGSWVPTSHQLGHHTQSLWWIMVA